MSDIRNTTPENLRSFIANAPVQPQLALDPTAVTKIAAAVVEENERRRAEAAYVKQAAEKRSSVLRQQTRNSIMKISEYRALMTLKDAGFQLTKEAEARLPQLRKQSEKEMEALEDRVIEHDSMKEELMEDLIEGAAEDPTVAAQLIEAASGEDVTPEEVEAAADAVAEVMVKEEVQGNTKESSAQRAQLQKLSSSWPEFTKQVVLARSTYKASQAINRLILMQNR